MRGKRIIQARNALKYCLNSLNENDRFAMIHFASPVYLLLLLVLLALPAVEMETVSR